MTWWKRNRGRDLPLVARAAVLLLAVDLGVRCLGLLPTWRLIRRRYRPSPSTDSADLARLQAAVRRAARRHVYPMKCLPQSLALAWLLARHGVAVRLRLGVRSGAGCPEAHAWLEHAGGRLDPAGGYDASLRVLEPCGADVLVTGELGKAGTCPP